MLQAHPKENIRRASHLFLKIKQHGWQKLSSTDSLQWACAMLSALISMRNWGERCCEHLYVTDGSTEAWRAVQVKNGRAGLPHGNSSNIPIP